VETPTLQLSFLCPYTNQVTDLVNSSVTTTANHSLTPSFSVYFHKQRKRPLTHRTTFWKPCPSALPTSQWQGRLTSSDLHKRSHLTSEREFIQKGVTNNTHQERTHQYKRPDCPATQPSGPGTPPLIRASCSSTSRSLNSTADLQPTNRVASGSSSLAADRRPRHYMATQLFSAVNITQ
jgi:hypothetical protein